MTVVENKLINLKNKIVGLKGVNRNDIMDLEEILNENVITKNISIEKFSIEESKQHYEVVLSAIDGAINKSKSTVYTMQDSLMLLHDLQDNLLPSLIDALKKLCLNGVHLDTNITNRKVFINENTESEALVNVDDLSLLDLIFNRVDIATDLFGDSRYDKIRGSLSVMERYEEEDYDFRILPWLLFLYKNKEKFIFKTKVETVFDITSRLFSYRLGFKVKDLNMLLSNLEDIIGVLELLKCKIRYYETYENVTALTHNGNELYHILKTLKELLDNDQLSMTFIDSIK